MQIYDKFKELSLRKKIQLIKSMAYELILIGIGGCIFFFFTFFFVWIITFVISPSPYQLETDPNFHLEPLDSDTLSTLLVNQHLKESICFGSQQQGKNIFQYEQVNLQQFCNLNYDKIPQLGRDVDILSTNMDFPKVKHITGCVKFTNQKISCQRYPISSKILLFKNMDLKNVIYLKVKLHMKSQQWPDVPVTILYYQHCNFIIRFIKDHYNIFSIVLSYGVTACFTLGAIIVRIGYLTQNFSAQNQKIE